MILTDVLSDVLSDIFQDGTSINLDNVSFYTKSEILERDEWPTTTTQLKNEVGSPHMQLNAGSGIKFVSATSDRVVGTLGETLTYPFSIRSRIRFDEHGSATTDQFFAVASDTDFNRYFGLVSLPSDVLSIQRRNTTLKTNNTSFSSSNSNDFNEVVLVFQSATTIEFFYNNSKETLTVTSVLIDANIDSFILGGIRISSPLYGSSSNQLFQVYNHELTEEQVSEVYNNPQQSIPTGSTVVVNLRLQEGVFLNGNIAINEGTGGNGTFSTTGAGSYDAAVNGLYDGYQKALGGININSGRTIISNYATSTIDIEGNPISNPWKTGRINCLGGLHGGTTAINVGNTKTVAFAIYVEDASTNQTIFETGSNDITLTSSAIASADFSSITVDLSTNTITDGSWHYVELQNATDVSLTSLRIKENFDGILIPFITYSVQISSNTSSVLFNYIKTLY